MSGHVPPAETNLRGFLLAAKEDKFNITRFMFADGNVKNEFEVMAHVCRGGLLTLPIDIEPSATKPYTALKHVKQVAAMLEKPGRLPEALQLANQALRYAGRDGQGASSIQASDSNIKPTLSFD